MLDLNSQTEFLPGDVALFTKWLGWASSPEHLNNDEDLLERERWFWVSGDAVDALEESLWDQAHDDEVPILLPEDLPSVDGIMLLADPIRVPGEASLSRKARRRAKRRLASGGPDATSLESLIAVRWTARSNGLVVQAVHGASMLSIMRKGNPDLQPGDLVYAPPSEIMLRPGVWQHFDGTDSNGLRHAPRNCVDGSPLLVLFTEPRIWPWGRRSRATAERPDGSPKAEIMKDATTQALASHLPSQRQPDIELDERLQQIDERLRQVNETASKRTEIDADAAETLQTYLSGWAQVDAYGGEAASDAYAAEVENLLTAKSPLLSLALPDGALAGHVPVEFVDLPDENEVRRLVAQEPLDCHHDDASLARLSHCLWGFASQPLPPNTPRRFTRDIPKHRRGADPDNPAAIRVMVLREAAESTGSSAGTGRRRRRHLVRGHWRRHWHPSLQAHRLRWIAPHLRAGNPNDPEAVAGPRVVRSVQAPHNDG